MGFSLSSAIGAAGALIGGVQALRAGDDNADAARDVAARQKRKTELEVKRTRRTARRVFGSQQVIFAKSGVRGDAGSALDIIADDMAEAELDVSLLEEGGSIAENLALSEARTSRQRGNALFQQGLLTAGSFFVPEEL